MPLRNSVTLVTGSAGFVGANLVRRLQSEGAEVHAVVRPPAGRWRLDDLRGLVTHLVDLTDREAVAHLLAQVRPDVVFHLAKHRGDPATQDYRAAYDANLFGTLNLLEAVRNLPLSRFVHAGSSLEYDLARSPLSEADAPSPLTVHGVTKAAAALLCQHFARRHGMPVVVLRLFTVYGPWEAPERFVPRLMMAAIERRPIQVTRDGLAHDWIFVEDVVEACLRAASADAAVGEIVNVATGRQSTNEDLVRLVEEIGDRPIERAPLAFPERPWDTSHWVADVTRATELLGWRASTDLRTGLRLTRDWFVTHGSFYRERNVK